MWDDTVLWRKNWPALHSGGWRLWSLKSLHVGGDGTVYEEWHGTLRNHYHPIATVTVTADATAPAMKAKKAMVKAMHAKKSGDEGQEGHGEGQDAMNE